MGEIDTETGMISLFFFWSRFVVIDTLSRPQFLENFILFVMQFVGDDPQDGLPDHLLSRVAENFVGPLVPAPDYAV